ncbi:MAG: fasciclin domain-containing protein [Acetobacter cibinongensis]
MDAESAKRDLPHFLPYDHGMTFWETSMRHPRASALSVFIPAFARCKPLVVSPVLLGAALGLAGCQSHARQDVYTTASSTCTYMMPTVSGTRTYEPRKVDASDDKKSPDSAIAYPDPETPASCDRPLSDTLPTSIELADYTRGLTVTGLLQLLQRSGPYTVFATPNSALEHYDAQTGGTLMAEQNTTALQQLLGYTIVQGKWPLDKIKTAALNSPTHSVGLPTVQGRLLSAWVDAPTGQVIIGNGEGQTSRLWVTGIPQSNGVLYFTQSLVTPPVKPVVTAQKAPHPPRVLKAPRTPTAKAVVPAHAAAPSVAVVPSAATQPLPGHRSAAQGHDSLTTPTALQLP